MNEIEMPTRMQSLPLDKHGRPVPWFVAEIDGEWDFRVIRRGGIQDALKFHLCWVCGQHLGRWAAFTIGPMCAVNRVSSEPPSHRDCAIYSARACPFLSTPNMKRRERHLPENYEPPAGISIPRNPGVALVWVTRDWYVYPDPKGQPLFHIGKPEATLWYAEGRDATRAEVLDSIESGLPILQEAAATDGERAMKELEAAHQQALELVPA